MRKSHPNNQAEHDPWSYLWLLAGTVLMVFIGGSWLLPLAGWLAPLFMLRFSRTQKPLRGYILLVVGLSIANTIGWWLENPMPFPSPVFGTLMGLFFSLPFLVDRLVVPRTQAQGKTPFASTLVFPLFLTAIQFLFFNNLILGSYGAWGYAHHSSQEIMQLVSITGIWGLIFLTGWFGAVVNWAWERNFDWPEVRYGLLAFAGIALLVVAFGSLRMVLFPPDSATVRVHAFTATETYGNQHAKEMFSLAQSDPAAFKQETARTNELYLEGTVREAQAGAQIVVWPEAAAVGLKQDIDAVVDRGRAIAQAEGIYLAMSVMILKPEVDLATAIPLELRLLVADPSGEVVLNHLKYAYGLGDPLSQVDLPVVDTPYGRLAGILCGDMDIPNIVKQVGRKKADILLVPSQETKLADLHFHVRYTLFRAAENGVSVVRPTAGGMSIATDPYGRIIAAMNHFATDDRVMVAQVPTQRVPTLFAVIGDTFGWLTVIGSLVIAGWAILLWRQAKKVEATTGVTG